MNFRGFLLAALALAALIVFERSARAQGPWHGSYYHISYGKPVALIVPPTARTQAHYAWGVGNNRTTTIPAQFQRSWPGFMSNGLGFRGTPRWPSTTDQFGVYYVRGPW
jgi:hypothetical protein